MQNFNVITKFVVFREISKNDYLIRKRKDNYLIKKNLPSKDQPKITENILEAIGMTPMVKLNNIPKSMGIKCQMCKYCRIVSLIG